MRRYLIAGLVVWIPIWVTYVVLRFLINLLDGSLALIPHKYQPEQLLGHAIPGLGLILTILIVLLTGMLATNFLGHQIVAMWERLLARIPLIRSIYSAVKQVVQAFTQPSSGSFRKVLLVEYPRKGIWSVGFQTANHFSKAPQNGNMIPVFIPTTPNPTSGFLIIVPEQETIDLEISIEEAFKIIVSLGVVMPKGTTGEPPPQTPPIS